MATPAPKAQDIDPFADRRAFPRVEVALPAFLQANGNRHPVQILDLSAGGAKLDCTIAVTVGAAVQLDCGTLARGAIVRWQDGRIMGICFDTELDHRDVAALAKRSTALAAFRKTRE